MRLSLVTGFILLGLAPGLSARAAEPKRSPGLVPVGVAVADITPDYPVRMAGYRERLAEFDGVASRLKARALAIGGADNGGPVILIAIDNLGLGSRITEEVAARLKTKTGLPRERLVISATHTHCAPLLDTGPTHIFGEAIPADHQARIKRYTQELTDALEKVALAALADRAPAQLSWGKGHAGFAANRRVLVDGRWVGFGANPNGPVNQNVPVLRVTNPQGKTRAALFGYACHCTTLSGAFNKICAEWAGYACEEVERLSPDTVALAVIGCGADSGPQPTGKLEYAQDHGKTLGAEVARLLKTELTPLPGQVAARYRSVELPLAPVPDHKTLEAQTKRPGAEGFLARDVLQRLGRGETMPTSVPYPIHTWCFGDDLAMVFLGGEVVIDYDLRLKWEIDVNRLWVTAYSDDVRCYIPSRRVLSEGGYEADLSMVYYGHASRFAPETEDVVVRTVHDLLPASFDGPRKP